MIGPRIDANFKSVRVARRFRPFTPHRRILGERRNQILGAIGEEHGRAKPLQRSAVPLLEPTVVEAETQAIRESFSRKRALMGRGLREAGVRFDLDPEGTFYWWGDVSGLPTPINDGMSFFRAALERKVICVPGEFFDVNPGKRRSGRPSRFRHYVRFSFGPEEESVVEGVRRIGEMVGR